MSKRFNRLYGKDFADMIFAGAARLHAHAERVNALNVFPVPDGDTGTNMNLTMSSGVEELRKAAGAPVGKAAEALSRGLLMGARGNSGVILSQLFRGFAKAVRDSDAIGAQQLAEALRQGVETAYQAVVRPVEGTILTVAREAAKHAQYVARRNPDLGDLMKEVCAHGRQALANTPELLPVLKQVGVVDAGGQGLIYIYEGFAAFLAGEAAADPSVFPEPSERDNPVAAEGTAWPAAVHAAHGKSAQAQISGETIEYGYCTEFIIMRSEGGNEPFREADFRRSLERFGDSLVVVADDDLVKVHIHAEYPGDVLNFAMKYGELSRIKIENMREQHSHIVQMDDWRAGAADGFPEGSPGGSPDGAASVGGTQSAGGAFAEAQPAATEPAAEPVTEPVAPYGIVTVASGGGIADIFASLGADRIISGGQTMNPSTQEIVEAASGLPVRTVFVLPNNSNIILAAQQAAELLEDKEVIVIPSKTIPQGIAALVAFSESADAESNRRSMLAAMDGVRSGQVTRAVRDTSIDQVDIAEGDYLAIQDGRIVASGSDKAEVCRTLIDSMLADGGEVFTLLAGEDAGEEDVRALVDYVQDRYADVEVEAHAGGQPVYEYIFSVE